MNRQDGCEMCEDPMFAEVGSEHPRKIMDLDVSTAVLNRDWQYYEGTSTLVFRGHETELHRLTPDMRHRFADDAARISAALERAFQPAKLNHALLGNIVPHLHWHLIPRRQSDPNLKSTIWEEEIPKRQLSDEEFARLASHIRNNIRPAA
jgi:diadenosine tetraphosphate (Ap4A) HIT family hydrolase